MQTKTAIVSGCDANYYPLLQELVASIRAFAESAMIDICIIDAGLSKEQVSALERQAIKVVRPQWPEAIPAERTAGKEYLKACVCRPFIPEIFSGYDMYMWLDADTWVQRWPAVEMFLHAARDGDRIALTNGADRAYPKTVRVSWIGYWPAKIKNFYSSNGAKVFGRAFARKMVSRHVLSAGCFALAATAPHWKRWQALVVEAAVKGKLFPAEQLSLGKLVHLEGYECEILPAYAHWLCAYKPRWDATQGLFVEPYPPYEPLGILHLSGVDDLRANRSVTTSLKTLEGAEVALNYRYPCFDGGALDSSKPERG